MTPRERLLSAMRRTTVRPVPVGALTQSATVPQMEAVNAWWPEAHRDPDAMARLAAAACEVVGFDFVRVPFDQTIEAELLGAEVDLGDRTSNASVRSHPLRLGDPVPAMPDLDRGRPRAVVEAIAQLRRHFGERVAVLGGLVGPFTLVCQLAGLTTVLTESVRRPDALRPYLDFAVELGIEYGRRQVAAGADAVTVEDMAASLDMTSPRLYQQLILPAQQQLVSAIPAPVVLHICGSNTRILSLLHRVGAEVISLEDRTDLVQAVGAGDCAIAGGVPTVEVLLNGTPERVRRAVEESLSAGVHILAPGCGLAPMTPLENLREMVRAAREWKG
jgi:[methyl-Co(III) methanol-specific corrinoid protein]:coenzyme M methyltransferase